jgi:hypothetical protein
MSMNATAYLDAEGYVHSVSFLPRTGDGPPPALGHLPRVGKREDWDITVIPPDGEPYVLNGLDRESADAEHETEGISTEDLTAPELTHDDEAA